MCNPVTFLAPLLKNFIKVIRVSEADILVSLKIFKFSETGNFAEMF